MKKKIINRIISPTLDYLKQKKGDYIGFLYTGLMIIDNEPFLIEYNVRMGDPECQTILPLLKNDFAELIESCIYRKLKNVTVEWQNKKSICIVLSSKGYPEKYKKNILIQNLEKFEIKENSFIFHAGTKLLNNKFYSTGGRVVNFVSLSESFKSARDKSLDLIKKLNWENGHYRKDIGYKVIDK